LEENPAFLEKNPFLLFTVAVMMRVPVPVPYLSVHGLPQDWVPRGSEEQSAATDRLSCLDDECSESSCFGEDYSESICFDVDCPKSSCG
jgi:hypothetical protein